MSNYIRNYRTIALFIIASFHLQPASVHAQPHITVAKPVQVSKSRSDMRHHEVLLAASPTDPNLLLGGSMTEPGTIAYMSRDGGETWTQAIEPPTTTTTADPA